MVWTSACYILSVTLFYNLGPKPFQPGRIWEDGENMKLQTGGKNFFRKAMLATVAFVGLVAFTGATSALADDDRGCQRRIAKADHKLHEAVEHHGGNSRQAEHARHELHEAREHCWNERHRWWDEDGHRWHSDRDWDDHDHDRH